MPATGEGREAEVTGHVSGALPEPAASPSTSIVAMDEGAEAPPRAAVPSSCAQDAHNPDSDSEDDLDTQMGSDDQGGAVSCLCLLDLPHDSSLSEACINAE